MGQEYILKQKQNGNLVAIPIPEVENEIPISLLNPRIRMGGGQFEFNGAVASYARYVETDLVSMIIHVPLLKWPMKIQNVDTDRWRLTDRGKVRDVYIKDVILITEQKPNSVKEVYILTKQGKVPQLTNIYDNGRICTGGIKSHDPQMMSPQEILIQLENSNGNFDLANSHDISLSLVGDKAVAEFTALYDNPNKFAKDRYQWT